MARVLSDETLDAIEKLTERYPVRMAALLPALHLAQHELGHLPLEAQLDIADKLDIPPTRVREVTSFYTMFYEPKVGRHVVKVCRNLACRLRGADRIMERAREILGVDFGATTPDGRVTLEHDECLASCGTGPALWCNDKLVERLTEDKLEAFLAGLK